MAQIYQKLSEKTLVLGARESYQRAFDFGNDWTEIRLGFFASIVQVSNANLGPTVGESIAVASVADRYHIGICSQASTAIPGSAGQQFIGISNRSGVTTSAVSNLGGGVWAAADTAQQRLVGLNENLTSEFSTGTLDFFATPLAELASGYCYTFTMRINIVNRGLANQSIGAYSNSIAATGTDYSATRLRTEMNNNITGSLPNVTIPWNTGVAARPIPDALYFRMPFFLHGIRISCMRIARYV